MTLNLTARVQGGRLVMDEPVDLPEGSVIELVPVLQEDELDDEDRARLHEALLRGLAQVSARQGTRADEVLARRAAKNRLK